MRALEVPLLKELNLLLSMRNPGFHFGLCPHYTLGFAGVSCLKALAISLNIDNNTASAAQCNSRTLMRLPQGNPCHYS